MFYLTNHIVRCWVCIDENNKGEHDYYPYLSYEIKPGKEINASDREDLRSLYLSMFGAGELDPVAYILTSEGTMEVNLNDWIITDVDGKKYSCKPDTFDKTYELVNE